MTERDPCCIAGLSYDEACLGITNMLNENVSVYGEYEECYKCPLRYHKTLQPNENLSLVLNTKLTYALKFSSERTVCQRKYGFWEHYRYQYDVLDSCKGMYVVTGAPSPYFPLFVMGLVLMILVMSWYSVQCLYRYTQESALWKHIQWTFKSFFHLNEQQLYGNRYKSVDVFRGFCVVFMIFTNSGGGYYWFFQHSPYNGITLSDAIMPWFLWIMGFSIAISINFRLHRGMGRLDIFGGVLKRSLVLVILGLMTTGSYHTLKTVPYNGTLQFIGVCYLLVGTFESIFFLKISEVEYIDMSCMLPEIAHTIPQWMYSTFLIAAHSVLTFMVSVPNCVKGYVGPGGMHDSGKHFNCSGGVAGYIDRQWLGKHLYSFNCHQQLYHGQQDIAFNGILAHLTGAALVSIGTIAGRILLLHSNVYMKIGKWIFYGILFTLVGGALCGFSVDEGLIPLNRALWSESLVFMLGGSAFIIIAILHWILDVREFWNGTPFLHSGMNSLIIFTLSKLLMGRFPFQYKPEVVDHMSYLCLSLWTTCLFMIVAAYLYYKKIFVKL